MFLKTVTARGFRAAAHTDVTCTLPGRFTLLVGGNNAGKTTICEAIYLAHRHRFPQLPRPSAELLRRARDGERDLRMEYARSTGDDPEGVGDGVGRAALRLADGADQLRVVVKDAGGNVVRSLELGRTDAGVRNFEWDGRNDNGGAVAKGDYSFTAQALKAGQATDVETLARMRVEGVLQTDTGARLNFGAAGTRSVGEVIEIL